MEYNRFSYDGGASLADVDSLDRSGAKLAFFSDGINGLSGCREANKVVSVRPSAIDIFSPGW
jgi:hypothetical protein